MKKNALIALLVVLTLAFVAQVITIAQVGPPTPPSHDPNSSSAQGTSNSSYGPSSSDEFPFPPWVLTLFGCEWVKVCDPYGYCYWVLICEDWVPELGPIYIP